MKNLALIGMLSITLMACENRSNKAHDKNSDADTKRSEKAEKTSHIDTDNTGRNVRDRDGKTLTPGNQSESELDRTITQRIRQALIADDKLSTNAKNIKIVTIDSIVTLRGPVANSKEREVIERKVIAIEGVGKVDNQLEPTNK